MRSEQRTQGGSRSPQRRRRRGVRPERSRPDQRRLPEPAAPAHPAVPPERVDEHAWAQLGLAPPLLAALRRLGFEKPTDIQRELIPEALAGRDVLGQARTGTGKTAAFALPMLQGVAPGGGVQGLVLVPTRELAVQVEEHVRQLALETPVGIVAVLGGRGIREQVAALRAGADFVVGTPGRVLDLMQRKELQFNRVRIAVLDEVDRMLDIGFRDDIRRILKTITHPHQTIFVSATIDDEIQKLARTFMTEPVEVDVSRDMLTVESIEQNFVTVDPRDKFPTLVGLLRHEAPTLAIVFTNTKHKARRVAQSLKRDGIDCREIHGDLVQERRERVMKSFRAQRTRVLVATDLASRGLDVLNISHIINYDVPEDASAYVHRVGRTARMGRAGRAISFVTREEGKLLTEIEKLINKELPRFEPPWLVRSEPPPAPPPIGAETGAAEETQATPKRYQEPRRRDESLETLGYRPIRRTLGSRFRSPRKRR